jgi:hypothetical protein
MLSNNRYNEIGKKSMLKTPVTINNENRRKSMIKEESHSDIENSPIHKVKTY